MTSLRFITLSTNIYLITSDLSQTREDLNTDTQTQGKEDTPVLFSKSLADLDQAQLCQRSDRGITLSCPATQHPPCTTDTRTYPSQVLKPERGTEK